MTWTIVARKVDTGAVSHAMKALEDAMLEKRIAYSVVSSHIGGLRDGLLFIGLYGEPAISRQTEKPLPGEEAFAFLKNGDARLLCGGGELGLAYAVIELAERIADEGEAALLCWPELACAPEQRVRGIDRFITNSQDEGWWMSREYWDFYFGMMLASRYNSFTLLFGFDTAYFSPPYPFFVETPGFRSVKVADWFRFDRDEYLRALNQIGAMCHDYGMRFTVAIWQQSPWQEAQKNMVEGTNEENLEAYCAAGLKALLAACPYVDKLHFRVNHESGVGTQDSAEAYWLRQIEALAEFNRETGRDIELELRAKGMTDGMLNHGKKCGLRVTVSTKYWCEQAGLPYHMTRMRSEEIVRMENLNASRRYSYADMLMRPRLHGFVYRLWNNGSTNLLTWGSPDYVRRFVDSLRLGDSDGFEVMPPISYKGGHQLVMAEKPWPLFDDPAFRPEGFEDSRYWLVFRLFGRIGYALREDEAAWMRPMRAHFGKAARPVMDMIGEMSLLIPYIVAFHFPSHPQQEYWAELNTGAALFAENTYNWRHKRSGTTYQNTLPSDEGLFYSIEQYAKDAADGRADGRVTPRQSAERLRGVAERTRRALAEAEAAGLPDTSEARGVLLDARMLIALAEYHAEKIMAALGVSFFTLGGDAKHIHSARAHMRSARSHWAALAELGRAYHRDLEFSTGAAHVHTGTWGDSLVELDADLERLDALCADAPESGEEPALPADIRPVRWSASVPATHQAGSDLRVTLDISGDGRAAAPVRLRWRRTNHLDGLFASVEMKPCAEGLSAVIPGEELPPEWDLMVYFESTDAKGDALQFPGILHPEHPLPYFIVRIR